ncbi:MFS transporter [Dactylosporangium sp. NPDC048998]|uniref:MFS transporter n=1 Tax=Dactylosporangium sp. NPDC048998 TaxID=3363976 RepID=UPI0037155DB9
MLSSAPVGAGLAGLTNSPALVLAGFFVSGLGFAPGMAALQYGASRRTPPASAPLAFGWLVTAMMLGGSFGTLVSGLLVDTRGDGGAFAAATAVGLLSAVVPVVCRAVVADRAAPALSSEHSSRA